MKEKTITCCQCENTFIFTIEEQKRYEEAGFNDPKRCPACRKNKTKTPPPTPHPKRKNKEKNRNPWQEYFEETDRR